MSSESSVSPDPQEGKFDHKAISIEATEIQPNCFKIEFEVPPEQVHHFILQLRAVKPDIKPQETATLLITTCLEEANARVDRHRFFEPRMAEGSEPPVLHPEKPFRATFIQDGFPMPDWPDFIAAKPSAKSSTPKRCVITRLTSSPFCNMAIILYQVSNMRRP